MAQHKSYQGHRNRNAWNVALYLFNDEGTYRMVQKAVRESRQCIGGAWRGNLDRAAHQIIGQLPAKTPDGVPYTVTNVRLALQHFEG